MSQRTRQPFILALISVLLSACGAAQATSPVAPASETPISATLFSLLTLTPQVENANVAPANPVETKTELGASSANEALGELYFFMLPHQTSQSAQLARLSGACATRTAPCPPLETVQTPFPFNFNLHALAWSPDGKFAAFSYSDQPNGTPTKLWLFDPSTNAWTSLAEFPFIDPPFWSPDGAWIAFRAQDGQGGENAYVVHRDGSELKSVAAGLPIAGRPYVMDGWSAENIIMRSALPGSSSAVYFIRASDGFTRPMLASLLIKSQFIAAPDASLLAYNADDAAAQKHELKIIAPDGANATTLANFIGGSLHPIVWSPNSQWIAFNYSGFSSGAPSAEVFLVSRDGGKLSSAYKGATVGNLVFAPNGKYLLVEETTSASGGHLFLVNLATQETKILQAPGLSADYDWYAPSWKP